jgi:L-ascorbate metabolism protein UlaG (beta-lactamase superfamily)
MKITLLGHSGFAAEGEKAVLVFDYFTDALGIVDGLPFADKNIIFFASHSHRDHYNKKILDFARRGNVGYVLGVGIPQPKATNAVVLSKGESAEMLGVSVKAFGSTDEGVSFLVGFEGKKVFHAGDLNDWYWEDESTPQELKHDEQWFFDEAAPLAGVAPDVAFVPADLRLGRHALRGAVYFAQAMKPRHMVLMHLSGGESLPAELRERFKKEKINTDVALIARPGDSITI